MEIRPSDLARVGLTIIFGCVTPNSFRLFAAIVPFVLVSVPSRAQVAAPASQEDDIIVTAPTSNQHLIDRHVYIVKDNARAQTENGLQLMRHVPSVTINSDDKVQLLGDPNVKILIDGHAVADGSQALKALSAGQIARIEVMTNPSAAYSAEGTSGAINVITRDQAAPDLSGAATVTRSDFGGVVATIAPSFAAGPWSASLSLKMDNSRFHNEVMQDRTATDPEQDFAIRRHNEAVDDDFTAHAELNYKPTASSKWALSFDHDDSDTANLSTQDTSARGSLLFPLVRISNSHWGYHTDNAVLSYSWTGARPGEGLVLSAALTDNREPSRDRVDDDFGDTSQTDLFRHDDITRSTEVKADYTHPFRKSDILTAGASVVREYKAQVDGIASFGDGGIPPPLAIETIDGTWTTAAAYAMLQFPVGKWTMLPGLRIEDRHVETGDLGQYGQRNDLFLFPSLHVDRSLTKRTALSLSYSRRVEWPSLRQLDPVFHYYDPVDAYGGNPALRPQLTNAVEAAMDHKFGRHSISLTLYDRETAHAWLEDATLVTNGVSLTSPANIGSLRRLGGELGVQGSIGGRWHYNASIDAMARRSTLFENGMAAPDEQFTYDGNAQIEYHDRPEGKPGANHLEFDVQYIGPTNRFQTRTSSYATGSLTWTRSLTARLSSIVKVNDIFAGDGSSLQIFGSDYSQTTQRLDEGRRIMASLVCRLGRVH